LKLIKAEWDIVRGVASAAGSVLTSGDAGKKETEPPRL
jgi:hypothetical protein